jgi:hypothetical protein
MVARRKTRKDERELPPAARENPYALLSREELDAAWDEVVTQLLAISEGLPERQALEAERGLISQGYAWLMVREGIGRWGGGKPKGADPLIEITPGPPISDYIIEDRR